MSTPTTPAARSGTVLVYGKAGCADTRRTLALLTELGVPAEFLDVEADAALAAEAARLGGGPRVPVVRFADGAIEVEPPDELVLARLGREH
ncbi:glutaredoxin [Agromyces mediolanus]|uniref:glutaredoxin family protein n=1 Tax=Agromyces mediolanus TaxID=41986 RepID=UPI002041E6D1|nr:glutaredoxin [Agromyces mediolanus]MCM3657824.1 glutaredoxin [Agromyces mediolanus]